MRNFPNGAGVGLLLALSINLVLAPQRAPSAETRLNGHVFTLPDGFEIELAAKAPLVNRPITGAFDEEGRLYVSDSSGSNDQVEKQLAERPHRILRLEDGDGDGRFDRHTIFADRMMFPEGTMWLDGSLYVSAPPSIWKLTDTDGDGIADRRTEWLHRTLTHCANDLHGPYAGPDGWIYWCKGAFAAQQIDRPGKSPIVSSAAHIFRARPDGTGVEPVMTGGMDNPVDVVFTPGGERIFSTTFLTNPHEGQRDGLIHAIYGGVYGKAHDVFGGHKLTGELMPPLAHLGPAACCGLVRYESGSFGRAYRDNLFTCCFNMHKLTRHVLSPQGATFAATTEDFLVSSNIDFHPTDVIEDADGSLLIVDTGGWYKLCCPTSQLWKPDILGAIYRVRRRGGAKIDDPRGRRIAWSDTSPAGLAELLGDPRPAVRTRAIRELAQRGEGSISALADSFKNPSADARRNAVWALTRINRDEARAAVRSALADGDETVRQAALNSISLWRDRLAGRQLIALLESSSPSNARAAAEALGRINAGQNAAGSSAVAALLSAAGRLQSKLPQDRILEHSLTYALIEIDDPQATRAALDSDRPWRRRIALIAVDQMDGGGLVPGKVAALLASADPVLKETASWIIGHHSDWGDALSGWLRERLESRGLSAADRLDLERRLAQFAKNVSVQKFLAEALVDKALSPATRQTALSAMRASGLRQMPAAWADVLVRTLEDADPPLAAGAVAAIRALPIPKSHAAAMAQALLHLADEPQTAGPVRLDAMAAVPGGLPRVSPKTFDFLRAHLDTELPVATRAAAAEVISQARLTPDQLARLTDSVRSAGPLEADRLLAAFENCADESIGNKLVAALRASPTLTSLRVDSIERRIGKQPASVRSKAEELYKKINIDLAKERQRIEEILPLIGHADVRRGQLVFARTKVACISCHQFGYAGGHIGPDLTRIGGIRSERDLLEAIMFPSLSFVRSFEPMQVVTKSGKIFNGLVRKDAPDEIVLVASATETVHVPREEIEELRPGTVSVMPAGLDKQLTPDELADLVAFLKNAK